MAKVTVIGGGIVGASISLNLAKAGCQVGKPDQLSTIRYRTTRPSLKLGTHVKRPWLPAASIPLHRQGHGCLHAHDLCVPCIQVTVVESALAPAPASTATARSWAWLNAINKQPRHYRGEARAVALPMSTE